MDTQNSKTLQEQIKTHLALGLDIEWNQYQWIAIADALAATKDSKLHYEFTLDDLEIIKQRRRANFKLIKSENDTTTETVEKFDEYIQKKKNYFSRFSSIKNLDFYISSKEQSLKAKEILIEQFRESYNELTKKTDPDLISASDFTQSADWFSKEKVQELLTIMSEEGEERRNLFFPKRMIIPLKELVFLEMLVNNAEKFGIVLTSEQQEFLEGRIETALEKQYPSQGGFFFTKAYQIAQRQKNSRFFLIRFFKALRAIQKHYKTQKQSIKQMRGKIGSLIQKNNSDLQSGIQPTR